MSKGLVLKGLRDAHDIVIYLISVWYICLLQIGTTIIAPDNLISRIPQPLLSMYTPDTGASARFCLTQCLASA